MIALTKSSNFVTWEALWLSYANFKGPAVKISFDFLNFLKFAITTLILCVEVCTVQGYFQPRLSIFFKYYIVNISTPETILNQLLFTVSSRKYDCLHWCKQNLHLASSSLWFTVRWSLDSFIYYPWDVALTKMTDVINIQFFEFFNVKHVI